VNYAVSLPSFVASGFSRTFEAHMKITMFLACAALALAASLSAQSTVKASRTPWGDPDISGLFTTDDELGVSFERPAQFGTRQTVTAEEFSQRLTQAERAEEADREEFVAPRAAGLGAAGTGPPNHWLERGKPSRRTSIVIDPPDGRIPFLNEDARRRGAIAAMRTPEGINFAGP
jgi:hypothetical protein